MPDNSKVTSADLPMQDAGAAVSESRIRWQCRRGMRELDELFLRYLESRYPCAPAAEKAAFQALLELPDPELVGYLLYGRVPESAALARIVCNVLGETAR